MIYNYTEFRGDNDNETDTCPECGSDRKVYSHYDSNNGKEYYHCKDCDEIYSL